LSNDYPHNIGTLFVAMTPARVVSEAHIRITVIKPPIIP